jgi:type IV pilus assembly protein PilB
MALSNPQSQSNGPRGRTEVHVLHERGKITVEQGKEVMQRANGSNDSIPKILVDMGIAESDVFKARAVVLGVPFYDLSESPGSEEAKNLLSDSDQSRLKAVPIAMDGKTLTVAMDNPKDFFAIEDLRMKTRMEIRAVVAAPSLLESFKTGKAAGGMNLNGNGANGSAAETTEVTDDNGEGFKYGEDVAGMLDGLKPVQQLDDGKPPKKGAKKQEISEEDAAKDGTILDAPSAEGEGGSVSEEAPIIRIVNTVLLYALKDGASDIHIEPQAKGVRIRYRIDGVLHEQMKIPQYVLHPLISRIKIMAEMNIAERRIPQDGRIKLTMQGKEYDMRVNTCPSVFGEKIVMRVLDKSSVMLGLDKIGLYPDQQAELLDIGNQPNGMLMVCGPTGSGKTTTLYSLLNVVSTIEKNVSTVEDPVEYQLPGLTQVQVNRKAGLTFATALRAFLRQDPDVIMVGEIRDLETAEIAVQASLTGHLVLSTVHTNDAPSTATRLGDMGVEPFLISASLTGALAQRLARRICPKCKEEYQPPRETLLRFGFDPLKNPEQKFWRGRGCDNCKQTGYKGRTGIYELMRVNEEMQELIVRRSPVTELKEAARANGMRTLQEDGFLKCKDGHTTVEEVMRVVFTGGH